MPASPSSPKLFAEKPVCCQWDEFGVRDNIVLADLRALAGGVHVIWMKETP
jgi:hypothetical protein